MFGGDSGSDFAKVHVGKFKGSIRCYTDAVRQVAEEKLEDELVGLMEGIIEIYEIEKGKPPMLGERELTPEIAIELKTLTEEQRPETLYCIRQTIEDAGLEKLNIFPMFDDLSF